MVGPDGSAELTAKGLRDLIASAGYQILDHRRVGGSSGRAWAEHANIDELGHKTRRSSRGARRRGSAIVVRTITLAEHGWSQVVIVTDHGWLYLPGGLPKVDLPCR